MCVQTVAHIQQRGLYNTVTQEAVLPFGFMFWSVPIQKVLELWLKKRSVNSVNSVNLSKPECENNLCKAEADQIIRWENDLYPYKVIKENCCLKLLSLQNEVSECKPWMSSYRMLWDLRLISFQQRFMSPVWCEPPPLSLLHSVPSSCPSPSTADWHGTQWHPGHEGRPAATTHKRRPRWYIIIIIV